MQVLLSNYWSRQIWCRQEDAIKIDIDYSSHSVKKGHTKNPNSSRVPILTQITTLSTEGFKHLILRGYLFMLFLT